MRARRPGAPRSRGRRPATGRSRAPDAPRHGGAARRAMPRNSQRRYRDSSPIFVEPTWSTSARSLPEPDRRAITVHTCR